MAVSSNCNDPSTALIVPETLTRMPEIIVVPVPPSFWSLPAILRSAVEFWVATNPPLTIDPSRISHRFPTVLLLSNMMALKVSLGSICSVPAI